MARAIQVSFLCRSSAFNADLAFRGTTLGKIAAAFLQTTIHPGEIPHFAGGFGTSHQPPLETFLSSTTIRDHWRIEHDLGQSGGTPSRPTLSGVKEYGIRLATMLCAWTIGRWWVPFLVRQLSNW